MSNRERILTLLKGGTPDRVPWFGDLDYWYSAEKKRGQLPEKYLGDGYFHLARDLGMGFYLQGFFPFKQHNPDITFSERRDGDRLIRTMHTPRGDLTEIQQYLPTSFSWGYVKHFAEKPADLPAFLCYLNNLSFTPAYEEAVRRKSIIGDNGVVLVYTPRSPFMTMVTIYVGIMNLVYLLADAPDQMAEVFAVMDEKYNQAAAIAVDAPADCVMIPENLSSEVVGASYYKRYLRPYEARWINCIRQNSKYSFIHMDGTLKGLLRHVAETGFDVIEAVTPQPSGDISFQEAAGMVPENTILWGGVPGMCFTPSFTQDEFESHVKEMLAIMRSRPRYVLGVADQVPPDGMIERVGQLASLCDEYGRY